jgi:hypothetical protein
MDAEAIDDARALAARLVSEVERSDLNEGGLIGRPLLRLAAETRLALARIGAEPPQAEKDEIVDPRRRD